MRGSLRARVDSLHSGAVSTVSSHICIYKDDKLINKKVHGNNKHKVIKIVVRL